MAEGESIKVFLFTSYTPNSYQVIEKLLSHGVNLVGVSFAPSHIKRLEVGTYARNILQTARLKDPGLLLRKNKVTFAFADNHNGIESEKILREQNVDVLLLYGTKIIKSNILTIPRKGTLNSHSALLPKYRGSKSEFWILYNNEPQYAGVTIHWVAPGLDEGDIFLQAPLAVTSTDTPESLRKKSIPITAKLFVDAIQKIEKGEIIRIPQDSNQATKYRRPAKEHIEEFKRRISARNRTIDASIQKAVAWLLYSGIQNPLRARAIDGLDLSGSFNAWFDLERSEYSYIYIEISGYALTTLLYLYNQRKEQIFLDRAIQVGEWLVRVQDETGAFPTALYRAEKSFQKPDEFHSFDVGIVCNGLALMYRITKKERFLSAAKKAADWMLMYQHSDGSLAAQVDKKTGVAQDSSRTWSTQPGPYHAKLAIGLLNIFDITKEDRYKTAAVALCEYALTAQQSDGQFFTYGSLLGTNLHPHFYAAEGLYVAGEYLHEERYVAASKKAVEWALAHTQNGLVPRHKHAEYNYNERVDILSQAVRLATLHHLETKNHAVLTETITGYQYFGPATSQHGGFGFGKLSDGTQAPHLNSWVTMFALQALMTQVETRLPTVFHLI